MTFSKDFLWGAATASYQVEGGINNNDWAKAAVEGRVPVCGLACDHYNRFEADFDLAKELGHNAHRLSIEWSRIEPEEGKFDEAAILHYRKVLTALRVRSLEPFVTLWHFTLPVWFSDKGGFESQEAPVLFARYCSYVVQELGDLCSNFATINEPNVYASHGYLYGVWPPFKKAGLPALAAKKGDGTDVLAKSDISLTHFYAYYSVVKKLIDSHKAAYVAIKAVKPNVRVSLVKHVRVFTSDNRPWNELLAFVMRYLQTSYFMDAVQGYVDEIGLNYYQWTAFGKNNLSLEVTDMGWYVRPDGLYEALKQLSVYKKPIYVAEAGLADEADTKRADYVRRQIEAMKRAMEEGVMVRAHLYWSLLDNYEWALGFKKRFGLIAVNYETQERTIRPSAYVYKDLIMAARKVE
jgi:beta-glucosidase